MQPRTSHLALAFLIVTGSMGQSGTITPTPNWRLGDKREVIVNVEMRIELDTVRLTSTSAASYEIEVTRARKEEYELAVRSGTMEAPSLAVANANVPELGSAATLLKNVVHSMYEPLSRFVFRYRIDKKGSVLGLVQQKDDRSKLTAAMSKATQDAWVALHGQREETPPIPMAALEHVMDSIYDAFLEVQVNYMNYFLKIYGTEFPLKGSLRQPVHVKDMQAPLHLEYPELPAILEAGLDKNDADELVGRTITTYDPDALFEYMRRSQGAALDQRAGLYLKEECVEHFDKRSGWLTNSTSSMRLRMGSLRMNLLVTTQLKPIG